MREKKLRPSWKNNRYSDINCNKRGFEHDWKYCEQCQGYLCQNCSAIKS